MKTDVDTRLRWVACALVLLLCAWVQSRVAMRTVINAPIRNDAFHYVSYAWNLKQHGVFSRMPTWLPEHAEQAPIPDKMTLPGYPAFLALLMSQRPDPALIQRVVWLQVTFGIATCALSLACALRTLPLAWSIAVGGLTAISPHLATANTYVLTESLFALLSTASLWLLLRANTERTATGLGIAGLALGLASLVRPQLQVAAVVLAAVGLLAPGWRRHRRAVLLGITMFGLIVGVWQWRNAQVAAGRGEPNLLASTLYHGAFPNFRYRNEPRSQGIPSRFDPHAADHAENVNSALSFIAEEFARQPSRMITWYIVGKPIEFLSWDVTDGAGDIFIYPVLASPFLDDPVFSSLRAASLVAHWPLMLAAVAVLLLAAIAPHRLAANQRQRSNLRLLALVFAVLIVAHVIGAPYPRYGIPFRPIANVLGVAGLHAFWHAWSTRRQANTIWPPSVW